MDSLLEAVSSTLLIDTGCLVIADDNDDDGDISMSTTPTPVMSTPVSAWTVGGSVPHNLEISAVVRSWPPISTISSVLASGADTSAAI